MRGVVVVGAKESRDGRTHGDQQVVNNLAVEDVQEPFRGREDEPMVDEPLPTGQDWDTPEVEPPRLTEAFIS